MSREIPKWAGYIPADCPNCGRRRLEVFVDADERALGIRCEKCFYQWSLDPEAMVCNNISGYLVDPNNPRSTAWDLADENNPITPL